MNSELWNISHAWIYRTTDGHIVLGVKQANQNLVYDFNIHMYSKQENTLYIPYKKHSIIPVK